MRVRERERVWDSQYEWEIVRVWARAGVGEREVECEWERDWMCVRECEREWDWKRERVRETKKWEKPTRN